MVAGAVVYSLVLIGVRELARLASLAMHAPHRAGDGSLHDGAHCERVGRIEDRRLHPER
jgi:hypothetical protein